MNVGAELDRLRHSTGMSRSELARLAKLSRTGLANILDDKKSPTVETQVRVCDALNISLQDLFSDQTWPDTDGHSRLIYLFENANEQARKIALFALENGQSAEKYPSKMNHDNLVQPDAICDNIAILNLPVMGRSAAGMPIEMVSIPNEPITINGEAQVKVGDFIVIAVGDSMIEAGIHDGDQCVIRPQDQVENGEIALIAVDDGSTIKRFYQDDQGIHLKPCNPAHPTQHYDVDAPIRVLGRFISVVD